MCLEYYILFETHFTRKKTVYQIPKNILSLSILKNNVPRYLIIEFGKAEEYMTAADTDVQYISRKIMAQNKDAYEVLSR